MKMITEDQARLRLNLREMPTTAKAYKRYLDKFDQQETRIEQLQQDLQKLRHTEGDRSRTSRNSAIPRGEAGCPRWWPRSTRRFSTVVRGWRFARAWLAGRLADDALPGGGEATDD